MSPNFPSPESLGLYSSRPYDFVLFYGHLSWKEGLLEESGLKAPEGFSRWHCGRKLQYVFSRSLYIFLLKKMGHRAWGLPTKHGIPQWPRGLVGSLSHTTELCRITLAKREDCGLLGCDSERLGRRALQDDALWCRISTLAERKAMAPRALVFSAKEALIKAISPVLGRRVLFKEVEVVSINESSRAFEVRWRHLCWPGSYQVSRGHIHTRVVGQTSAERPINSPAYQGS